jgi:hypothetical protein
LSSDAGWEARGNKVQFKDRHMRPFHDFGWSATSRAGGKVGEIGGIIWRDEKPAYYASKVGPLTLDDELFASGRIAFNGAGSDSGVYLGWFNSNSKTNKTKSDHVQPQANVLAGAARRAEPHRDTTSVPRTPRRKGEAMIQDSGPIIRPDRPGASMVDPLPAEIGNDQRATGR